MFTNQPYAQKANPPTSLIAKRVLDPQSAYSPPSPLYTLPRHLKKSLSSKLLDKQARLEESVRERTTLKAKLRETTDRAFRAEQELREFRGESLESGGGGVGGGVMRARRGRNDRLGGGRGSSASGAWSRLGPIAKHKKVWARGRCGRAGVCWLWSAKTRRANGGLVAVLCWCVQGWRNWFRAHG